MALEKVIEQDKIEIVGPFNVVQIRTKTSIVEDGEEISSSFSRHSINPTDNITNETAKVTSICNAVHTEEIKAAYTAFIQASLAELDGE